MAWQTIETAPKDASRVALWCPKMAERHGNEYGYVMGRMVSGEPRGEMMTGDWVFTHWMPLPAPPQGE